jgi:hypothetical protein
LPYAEASVQAEVEAERVVAKMPVIQACRLGVVLAEEEPFHLVQNNQDTGLRRPGPYQGSLPHAWDS